MKEKKYLRLLPFRARQEATRTGGSRQEMHTDEELTCLLRAWEAPDAPHASDARLLASFRRQTSAREPFWRRLLTASVRVPVPVAALAVLVLLGVTATLVARPSRVSSETVDRAGAPPARETTKIVEVPVVQERVVTRVVYVEKNERRAQQRAGDGNLSEREQPRRRVRQEQPLASAGRERAGDTEAQGTGYLTRVNMEDFQPANQMQIRMIKRGNGDEK